MSQPPDCTPRKKAQRGVFHRTHFFLTECLGIGAPDAVSRILNGMKGLTRHRRTGPHPNDSAAGTLLPRLAAAAWIGIALVLSACATRRTPPPPYAADCPHPARMEGHLNPAMPNVIALVRKEADVFAVSARIAGSYPVHLRVLDSIHMLVLNDITKSLVERLRCEADIEGLSYDTPIHIG